MRLGRDGISGLIGLAVSLALLSQSFGLPKLPLVPIGPGFYPALILGFTALACLALIVQDLLAGQQLAPPDAASVPAPASDAASVGGGRIDRGKLLVAASFATVTAYIALLPLLGFRIATTLFVAAFQVLLERPTTQRQLTVVALVAVLTAAITYVVFESYLMVLLPRGTLTGW